MKERPILMRGPLVRATFADEKDTTRRIIKVQPSSHSMRLMRLTEGVKKNEGKFFWGNIDGTRNDSVYFNCPYGQNGDRLWVKETFLPKYFDDGRTAYRADWNAKAAEYVKEPKWKSSLFMPRNLARLLLEIIEIRVERLQDITEEGALAEGVDTEGDDYLRAEHAQLGGAQIEGGSPAVFAFKGLWESINGRGSWELNPWLWVIKYRRINENNLENN